MYPHLASPVKGELKVMESLAVKERERQQREAFCSLLSLKWLIYLTATCYVPSALAVLWLNNYTFKRSDALCVCVFRYNQELKLKGEEVPQS